MALAIRDYAAARELFAESLRRQHAAGNIAGVVEGINGLAALAAGQGQPERAARLAGAADAIAATHPAPVWPAERYEIERYRAVLGAGLRESLANRLRDEGSVYSVENAIAYALADGSPAAAQRQRRRGESLSEREREVAALIGQGASNRARITARGTQRGPLMGKSPTGRTFAITVIDISRFENGKMIEHWGVADRFHQMEQLGVLPQPQRAEA